LRGGTVVDASNSSDGNPECIECHHYNSGDGATEEAGFPLDDATSCDAHLSATVSTIKRCTSNGDCTLANETVCCTVVIGIRVGTEQTLANALQAYNACGAANCGATVCPPGLSENGTTRQDDGAVGTLVASCDKGLCMSHVK
jgi:hypothetical protein